MTNVVLPELGENIQKAIVSYWYLQEGETAQEKDDLVEIATDKATFNLPSPCAGIIREIFFREGDSVNIGETLAVIEEKK